MTLSKFMQNSVFVNSGAIQGKILGSFYLKSTLLYDREVSYSWDKKNNELRYCLDVCVCVCVCVYTLTPVGFFRLHDVFDIREKFGSTIFCCEYSVSFCQVPSSLFLNLSYFTSKDENSSHRLLERKWYDIMCYPSNRWYILM